jgi:cytochrome c biogenesis protein
MIWRLLASPRLTVPLLLGLALAAVFGTFAPLEEGRYEIFYQRLWFRLLLGLLALNLGVCTVRSLRHRRRLLSAPIFPADAAEVDSAWRSLPDGLDRDRAAARLAARGYRVVAHPRGLLAQQGIGGRWGGTVVHLSLLMIMAGALLGGAGFVGTRQLYVGHEATDYFDWATQADRPLGFTLRLDHFEPVYYPIELRLSVVEADGGGPPLLLTTREGETIELPRPGLTAQVEKFLPFERVLFLQLYRDGLPLGRYQALPAGGKETSPVAFGLTLHPDAFKDPLLKQLHSEVSILEAGQVVRQGVIAVNRPLVHRGVTIYQTAHARDQFGFWYAGFQLSRDPGEPLVWSGCVLLSLGLLTAFFQRWRVLLLAWPAGRGVLKPLRGFAGEAGKAEVQALLHVLAVAVIADGGVAADRHDP